MTVIVFDSESTGFPNKRTELWHPSQPHLVQFACVVEDDDGAELERHNLIARPDGWKMTPRSEAVHKISQERAMDEGVPLAQIVDIWDAIMQKSPLGVAHYAQFDLTMMEIATLACRPKRKIFRPREIVCTMKLAGELGVKPAQLSALYARFTGQILLGAHDAMVDVDACRIVYRELVKLRDKPMAFAAPGLLAPLSFTAGECPPKGSGEFPE